MKKTLEEIDALVAEHVMGWKKIPVKWDYMSDLIWMWDAKEGCYPHEVQITPKYSSQISCAWDIVAKYRPLRTVLTQHGTAQRDWAAHLAIDGFIGHGNAETPELALCLAALDAKKIKISITGAKG